MTKIIHKTLRQEVVNAIRLRILNGEFKEGERLVEQDLAQMLGVSRGPIREALRQIEQEGLVEYTSHIGCSVRGLTEEDIYEIYMLRANLEILATRLCKGQFSSETIHKMQQVLDCMEHLPESCDLAQSIECDRLFHRCIIQEVRINRLLRLWESMDADCALIFYKTKTADDTIYQRQGRIHADLMQAILSQDEKQICESIMNHYMLTTRRRLSEKGYPEDQFRYSLELRT